MPYRSIANINRPRESAGHGEDIEFAAHAADLPAMIATLCSYDGLFGPRHIQTLSLAANIAEVLRGLGQQRTAMSLLERVVRDLAHSVGRAHARRISALSTLRDLLIEHSDIRRATAIQAEITECWELSAGPDAVETITARTDLGALLMSQDHSSTLQCPE